MCRIMRIILRLSFVALFLGCVILGYIDFRQKTALISAENDARNRITRLQGELTEAKESIAKLDKQRSNSQRDAAGEIARQPVAKSGRTAVQISDIIKAHPEFLPLYSKMIRRSLNTIYGDGLNSLKLTPDQLNKLKGLLTEREMSRIDANQASVAAGLTPGSTAWQEVMNQASLTNDQEIQDLLGPNAEATLAQLKSDAGQTQAKMLMQFQVDGISSDFTDAGLALTADQSNGLTQALLNGWYWQGRDLSDRPVNYNDVDPNTGLSPHDIRNLNNAVQVLTPAQLSIFQDYETQMEKVYAIQRQYHLPLGPINRN
jgi:hypothetical protein